MFALALLATVFGAIYPLVVNAGYDSGISVGFVTTSLAVTGLMALVSKRLDDLKQLAIVNSEMQGVVAVLRQEAWVTKNQLAKAIHGSVQAKFLAVALRIANSPKLSDADLEAARKDIESSLDDVAISLEGRTDSFAKQFKTITDAWDGVAKIKLKADKETIALINRFPVARTCVLEVIGEAVANAAKHSKAPSMDIELQENSLGQLAVSVWSAGKLSDQPSRKGYGSQMLDEVTSGWSLTNFKGRIYLRAIVQLAK
jgi:signal transduction histidine kinase